MIDSENVTLTGFTVDGAGAGNSVDGANANFVGVVFRNSSGGLTDVDVTGIRDAYPGGTTVDGFPVQSGMQRGVGVQVDNDSLLDFFMHGGTIADFQKNATVFSRADLDVSGVTITGSGAQTIIAQNGFQATLSTGTITNNTITAIGYAGPALAYSGIILVYGNTDLDITDNTITGTNGATTNAKVVGIFVLDFGTPNSGGSITGNVISFVDTGIDVSGDIAPNGILIEDNTITDVDQTDPYAGGVSFYPNVAATPFDIDGSAGNDFLQGGSAGDTFDGLAGNDTLDGAGGNDDLTGSQGEDQLTGGAGDDMMDGGSEADSFVYGDETELTATETVDGGTEIDSVVYADANGGTLVLTENVTNVERVVISNEGSFASVAMNVDASALEQIEVYGNTAANVITLTAGDDYASGGGGDDTIEVGGGSDEVEGGAGFDTVVLAGNREDWEIEWDGTTATLTRGEETVTVTEAGRLQFDDKDVLLVDDGSAEFSTLQSAVDAAASGDEILVGTGVYTEVVSVTDGKALTISGGHGGSVSLSGSISLAGVLAGTFTLKDLSIDAGTNAYGVLVSASDGGASAVVLDGVNISNANQNGFAYVRAGNGGAPTLADTIDAVTITNGTLTNNGDVNTGSGGRGDILLFGFNGDLTLSDLVISNTTGVAQKAIQVRGVQTGADVEGTGPYAPAGDLVMTNVAISGTYLQDAIAFYRIAGFADTDLSGVTFNGSAPWGAFNIDSVGGTFDLSGYLGTVASGQLPSTMQGLASVDTFTGSDGVDLIDGRGGADSLAGGDGADLFRYTDASHFAAGERVDGGGGIDTVVFAATTAQTLTLSAAVMNVEQVSLMGTAALNVIASQVGNALKMTGNGAANSITGSLFNDTITGGAGADTLIGARGNDVLEGGIGADILNGGANTDTASYASSSAGVNVDLFASTASGGDAAGDILSSIEGLLGSVHADTLTGDEARNTIDGNGGSDVLDGGAAIDTVSFALDWADYTITRSVTASGSTYTLVNGADTITAENFETFVFNGVSVDVTENPDVIVTNAPPVITSIAEDGIDEDADADTYEVEENAEGGTRVLALVADDANLALDETLTFTLVDGAGDPYTGPFTIVQDDDTSAHVETVGSLNHEDAASHSFKVRITDANGNFVEQEVTVGVLDVNEVPTD
ncbi:MAG: hypothetical protein ACRC14_06755, partial [Paracoccaceae bacterium]